VKLPKERAEAERLVVAKKRPIKAWSEGAALLSQEEVSTTEVGGMHRQDKAV
jgi:hypothetical protein